MSVMYAKLHTSTFEAFVTFAVRCHVRRRTRSPVQSSEVDWITVTRCWREYPVKIWTDYNESKTRLPDLSLEHKGVNISRWCLRNCIGCLSEHASLSKFQRLFSSCDRTDNHRTWLNSYRSMIQLEDFARPHNHYSST